MMKQKVVKPSMKPSEALADVQQQLDLSGMLEAILMVADSPISVDRLAVATNYPENDVLECLEKLAEEYDRQRRGFALRSAAGGWRFYSSPQYADIVNEFVLEGQSARLTQAALETLAVIAYSQPVTRGRISAIRGVNVDSVVRTLVARGLVEEAGQDGDGGAYLYRTTAVFEEKLGLNSLEDLPPLAPYFPELSTMDVEGADR